MKRFLLFALVATMFAACVTDATQDVTVSIETPETLTVSFEEGSRIQLQNGKTVWTKGDLVSVFYRSNANQKWQYQGETGERNGTLKRVANAEATQELSNIVVIYPYNENYYINPRTCNVQASLPATQTYLADSYGLNGNIMVSQSEYNQIALKSVCGWLKLQLTGDGEVIKSIALKGNNGEQVAGEVYINSADATCVLAAENGVSNDDSVAGGNLVFDDTILTEVVLDCDEGVTLGAEATAFYIALPPQTFENGLTVTFTNTDGASFEKSMNKAVVIERNTIQPMAALMVECAHPCPANNEIWYTTTDRKAIYVNTETYNDEVNVTFGANIVSNTYEDNKGIIKFDGDITAIASHSFYSGGDESTLQTVVIPGSVTSIGRGAFEHCSSLTSVTIPDGVTEIGEGAFSYCDSLTSITMPGNLASIGVCAFDGCRLLTSITIPDGVTFVGERAFGDCHGLMGFYGKYASEDNRCLVIDGALNAFAPAGLTEYYIPNGVTSIGETAFARCEKLTSVSLPESVVTIGIGAFVECYGIMSMVIPNSVTRIEEEAFTCCESLKELTIGNGVTFIGLGAFAGCGITSVTIPESVVTIEECPFYCCSHLTSFYGKFASEDNRCLVVDGTINSFAPAGLTEYTLPNGATSIGEQAFGDCSSLTSITIPDSVTSIGDYAFGSCSALNAIYCKPVTPPSIGESVFDNNASNRKIYVPMKSVEAYKAADTWRYWANAIEGCNMESDAPANNEIWYTTTTGEKASLFQEEYMISRFNITAHTYDEANGVWVLRTGNEKWTEFPNIDTILFNNPSVVNSVYMPNCIETINGELRGTTIASIKLPTNLKSIGDRTFEGCAKLESVTIPNGVTSIGNNAFAKCTSLNNLEIPNSVATFNLDCIGGGYYENMGTRLTKLTIGSGVTEITGRYRMEFGGVISELYLKPNTPPTNIKALFYDVSSFETKITSRMKIYVPIGSEEAYKQALTWESYSLDSIIIGVNF